MQDAIDLRSDTVTRPTAEMRRAMAEAEVGDDVYGEDPTVNRLQERAAEMLGKEAALLLPSGTMANQVAVLTHTRHGQEVLVEQDAHVFFYEAGGIAALAGCQPRTFPSDRGIPAPRDVEAAIRPANEHFPPVGLLCLENTHNRAGGTVVDEGRTRTLADVARRHELPVHLDGARIFNAAAALGVEAATLAAPADSVMVSLSKGLAAPVGSVLAGSRAFIAGARRRRKLLGGGMRQAGVIAAAGLVALERMVARLADDHEHARRLAAGLADLGPLEVEPQAVQTNMVVVGVSATGLTAPELVDGLAEAGVLVNPLDREHLRLVLHNDVSRRDVEGAVTRFARVLRDA